MVSENVKCCSSVQLIGLLAEFIIYGRKEDKSKVRDVLRLRRPVWFFLEELHPMTCSEITLCKFSFD